MKNSIKLFALLAICFAMSVSCKNVKSPELHIDQAQDQNIVLADSVMNMLNEFADQYVAYSRNSLRIPDILLTEQEKLVKPDYLFDPNTINNLTTRSQKINALSMLFVSRSVRQIYDMPLEETDAAIAKLVAEVNHPITNVDEYTTPGELYKVELEKCKERGELMYFWNAQKAIIYSITYVVAQDPELFFSKFTQEQWESLGERVLYVRKAIEELAKYDDSFNYIKSVDSDSEVFHNMKNLEFAKKYYTENKSFYIDRYNDLI